MFPSWDSLSDLERFQDYLGRINFWGPYALAAISLAIALAWGLYNRSVDTRVEYLRGVRDGESAAELQRRLTLPDIDFPRSLAILQRVSGPKVHVISVGEDRTQIIVNKLELLFMAAGWRASFDPQPWKFRSRT